VLDGEGNSNGTTLHWLFQVKARFQSEAGSKRALVIYREARTTRCIKEFLGDRAISLYRVVNLLLRREFAITKWRKDFLLELDTT
jgi:hypothetical protein